MDASEQIQKFKEFFDEYYLTDIMENFRLGNEYLFVDFNKLSAFDIDLADSLLEQPEEVIKAAELAITDYEMPKNLTKFYIRFDNLPFNQEILVRNIRSKHIGKLYMIDGVVRQKSDVRPQVTNAKFECPSCGNIISILQADKQFREPTRCGCGRKGKFILISKELIDAQSITLEEIPEKIEGGAQPKRMKILLKEDLVSPYADKNTNPGSKINVVGYVKEVPITTRTGGKSTTFDLMVEANNVTAVEESFSDISLSEEDRTEIEDLSKDPKVYEKLIDSIAPSTKGYNKIKEALLLQLLGGVQKRRDDGVTLRGDMHVLLIGDPGSGKCLHGDTKIILQNGNIKCIKDIADEFNVIDEQEKIDKFYLPTAYQDAKIRAGKAIRIWKRPNKDRLLKVKTRLGKKLILTKNHPLFTVKDGIILAKEASDFIVGNHLASPRKISVKGALQFIPKYNPKKYSNNSKEYKYPEIVDEDFARLLGYLTGDGYLAYSKTSGWISLTNNDIDVLNDFKILIKKIFNGEITLRKPHKAKTTFEVYLMSKAIVKFLEMNFSELFGGSKNKSIPELILKSHNEVFASYIKALFECDSHVNLKKRQIEFCTISKDLAEKLQHSLLRFGIVAMLKKKKKFATNTEQKNIVDAYELIISGNFVQKYEQFIGYTSKKKIQLKKLISKTIKHNTNIDLLPGVNYLLKQIRTDLNLTQSEMGIPRPTYAHYEQNNRLPSIDTVKKIVNHLNINSENNYFELLKQLSQSDLFWDEIVEIREVEKDKFVYDFEVDMTHNYLANGVVVHNSQLLKRISTVAPKARYVSGKGVSGAGLTATVVKDEFLGGWSLEAGALVLANKGFVMIDEMDKMTNEDRSAMHEALEQQTVSISKANIQATLRAETTVLAAANPKFGRFDPYEMLAKQIDLPTTLINRFDLIFPIRDLPNKERDTELASFILEMHKSKSVREVPISTETIRKYISYARQMVAPMMSDAATREIRDYFVKMRNVGAAEGKKISAIPISARQLEALVRMSEASAKTRLSTKVLRKDAKRAIELLHYCLSQVGMDPETGKIDIDRIATGVSASQRSKIASIKEIINLLEGKIGKTIPIEDIVKEADAQGIEEVDVMDLIEKLKRAGDIFEPTRNKISKI